MGYTRQLKGKKVMIRPLTRCDLEEVAKWPKYTGPYSCYNWKELETQEGRDEWYARRVEGEPSSFWSSIHKLNGDLIGILNIHRLKDDPWHREAEIRIGIRAGQLPPHKCESLQLRSTAIHRKQELLGCFGFNTHRVGLVDNSLPAAPNSPAGTCVS